MSLFERQSSGPKLALFPLSKSLRRELPRSPSLSVYLLPSCLAAGNTANERSLNGKQCAHKRPASRCQSPKTGRLRTRPPASKPARSPCIQPNAASQQTQRAADSPGLSTVNYGLASRAQETRPELLRRLRLHYQWQSQTRMPQLRESCERCETYESPTKREMGRHRRERRPNGRPLLFQRPPQRAQAEPAHSRPHTLGVSRAE